MDPRAAVSAYKNDNIENAPPLKIVRMLYQAALRHIDAAVRCDAKDPSSTFIDALSKADAVVSELRLALEKDAAPDVSENLEQLYLFVESSLQTAMTERDGSGLTGAREVLATLLEAWSQLELEARKASAQNDAA